MGQMRRDRGYLPLFKSHEVELVTRILFARFQGSLVGQRAASPGGTQPQAGASATTKRGD